MKRFRIIRSGMLLALILAMAASLGLYAENQALKARVDDLESRLAALEEVKPTARAPPWSAGWLRLGGLLLVTGCVAVQQWWRGGKG